MPYPLLLLLLGLLYTFLFGLLAWLRREGLPARMAIEAILLTLLAAGLAAFSGAQINPVFFLIALYLITLRVRILADLGAMLAMRRQFDLAGRIFNLALRLGADSPGRQVIHLNQGVLLMQIGQIDASITTLTGVLVHKDVLSAKNEAAAHYDLAMAYLKKDRDRQALGQALVELQESIDASPSSEYGRRASAYLADRKVIQKVEKG
jgi:tetratricopeptide (TPR) repeat protein